MRRLKKVLLFFPALNIIADFLFVFKSISATITVFRGIFLLFILVFFILKYSKRIWSINKYLIIMLFYFTILLFLSSKLDISFPIFIKYFSSLFMFPIFYLLVEDFDDVKIIKTSFMLSAFVFVINFFIADIFNLGASTYDKGTGGFNPGNFTASALYTGSVILIVTPVFNSFFQKKNRKKLLTILAVFTLIFLILSMRRTAIFIVIIGYIVIGFFYRKKSTLIKYSFLFLIIGSVFFAAYFDKIQDRVAVRADRFEEGSIEKEGRYLETVLIWNNILSFENKGYSFFGNELFNSAGNYNYPDPKRVIHGDYSIILSGSGLIGFFIYVFFNLTILMAFYKSRKTRNISSLYDLVWVVGLALLIISIASSFSSGLFAITYRTTVFAYLGAFLAIINKRILPS